MNAATRQPAPVSSGVRPADRLGFTLAEPSSISQTLEITLSTFKSEDKPKEADFLAQDNQQGSGTLEHKAAPKTSEQAPFQDTEVRKVSPAAAPPPSNQSETPKTYARSATGKNPGHPAEEQAGTPEPSSPDLRQLAAERRDCQP